MSYEAKPGDVIGLYRVSHYLKQGGMAYVVIASSGENKYALKIAKVNESTDQEHQNNLAIRKEAHLLAPLEHDRIVKVLPVQYNEEEFRTKDNSIFYARATELPESPWYFVMEYLAGGTLEEYIKKCGPLTVREATSIIGNIGLGLGYLHSKGIAHNDVKPDNIVFRNRIIRGRPYDPVLIDFGTAAGVERFVDEAGSWYSMAPERIRIATGRDAPELATRVDPVKADIWAMGMLLYQALTNRLPFSSPSRKTLTSQILNDSPDTVQRWNNKVPLELDRFIVSNCLSKRPEDRPTLKEFQYFLYQFSGRKVPAESIKDGYYGKEQF